MRACVHAYVSVCLCVCARARACVCVCGGCWQQQGQVQAWTEWKRSWSSPGSLVLSGNPWRLHLPNNDRANGQGTSCFSAEERFLACTLLLSVGPAPHPNAILQHHRPCRESLSLHPATQHVSISAAKWQAQRYSEGRGPGNELPLVSCARSLP